MPAAASTRGAWAPLKRSGAFEAEYWGTYGAGENADTPLMVLDHRGEETAFDASKVLEELRDSAGSGGAALVLDLDDCCLGEEGMGVLADAMAAAPLVEVKQREEAGIRVGGVEGDSFSGE